MNYKSIINELIDVAIVQMKREENKRRIETTVIEPLLEFIIFKLKPYILGMSIFLVVIILLVICFIINLLFKF